MNIRETLPDISIKFNADYGCDHVLIEIEDHYRQELSIHDLDVEFLSSLLEHLGHKVNLDTTHKFEHDDDMEIWE